MKSTNRTKSMGLLSMFVVLGMLAAVVAIPSVSALDVNDGSDHGSSSIDLGGFGYSSSSISLGHGGFGRHGSSRFGHGGFGRHGGFSRFGHGGFSRFGGCF